MAGPTVFKNSVNPLTWNVPIVDSGGKPTPEFQNKWSQQATTNATIPDLSTAAKVSGVLDLIAATPGSLLARGASVWAGLAPSAAGKILKDNGAGVAPSWDTLSNVVDLIGNVQGDVLYRSAAGWSALAPGTAGQVLTSGGAAANPAWATPSSGGAASIQDNGTTLYIALSDTDGQLVLDGAGDPIFSPEVLPVSAIPALSAYALAGASVTISGHVLALGGTLNLAAGDVSGLATSATTDTTNASNIGSGTLANARLPAAGGYATGSLASLTVNKVKGVTDGSAAAAGDVGEVLSSILAFASAVLPVSNTPLNVTSLVLTPGDWDVSAVGVYFPSTTSTTTLNFALSTVSATLPSITTDAQGNVEVSVSLTTNASCAFGIPPMQFNVTVNTTIYLVHDAVFTGAGTPKAWGTLRARRMR